MAFSAHNGHIAATKTPPTQAFIRRSASTCMNELLPFGAKCLVLMEGFSAKAGLDKSTFEKWRMYLFAQRNGISFTALP